MYRYIFFIFFLYSCGNKTVATVEEKQPLQLRYRNVSADTFLRLETEVAAGKKFSFTNVLPYSVTDFVPAPPTYFYHHVNVVTPQDSFELQPIDYLGEQPFTAGYLTIGLDIITGREGKPELVFVRNAATPVRDYHTPESDVIDNLFTVLNNDDFTAANEFYAPGAALYDASGKLFTGRPGDYFQQLFMAEDINYIYVYDQHREGDDIHATVHTRHGVRSAEFHRCFQFEVENNRITTQRAAACK